MKLIRCYVCSFGKLNNFTYEFDGGLNTIKHENGWGKTTLATFIKAMFYGISSSKRSVSENERIKYRPWNQSGLFGGNVEFEWGGKQFKLERYFGAKESEDTVRLFDNVTGKEFSSTNNLGERIFEIDEEGFLSTTYFSQKDFQIKSNTSLTAKFNSVCEIQDAKTFDKALEKLEEKAKFYKIRGDKGAISDVKREINYVEMQLEEALSSSLIIKGIKQEIIDLEQQTDKLKANAVDLTIKMEKQTSAKVLAVKKSQYDGLLEQKVAIEKEIESYDKVLNGNSPNEQEINGVKELYNELLAVNSSKKIAQQNVDDLQRQLNSTKNLKTNKKGRIMISGMLTSVFALLSIVLMFVDVALGLVSLIGFAVSLTFLVYYISTNKNTTSKALMDLLENYKSKHAECAEMEAEYSAKLTEYLSCFVLPADCSIENTFDIIKNNIYQKRNSVKRLAEIEEQLKAFEGLVDEFDKLQNNTINLNALRLELDAVQDEYAKKTGLLANKKASLKTHEQVENGLADLESKKANLVAKLTQYVNEYKIILTTIEYLKKADENLKIKYRAPLQESLNRCLNFIDGNNSKVNIDIDLNVSIEEPSGQKSTEYYSKGYQNLFEICKRFALTDVLFNGEKPFIILDDPFYNLDDEKLKSAIALIKKLSDEYQILYLVCHESRVI